MRQARLARYPWRQWLLGPTSCAWLPPHAPSRLTCKGRRALEGQGLCKYDASSGAAIDAVVDVDVVVADVRYDAGDLTARLGQHRLRVIAGVHAQRGLEKRGSGDDALSEEGSKHCNPPPQRGQACAALLSRGS